MSATHCVNMSINCFINQAHLSDQNPIAPPRKKKSSLTFSGSLSASDLWLTHLGTAGTAAAGTDTITATGYHSQPGAPQVPPRRQNCNQRSGNDFSRSKMTRSGRRCDVIEPGESEHELTVRSSSSSSSWSADVELSHVPDCDITLGPKGSRLVGNNTSDEEEDKRKCSDNYRSYWSMNNGNTLSSSIIKSDENKSIRNHLSDIQNSVEIKSKKTSKWRNRLFDECIAWNELPLANTAEPRNHETHINIKGKLGLIAEKQTDINRNETIETRHEIDRIVDTTFKQRDTRLFKHRKLADSQETNFAQLPQTQQEVADVTPKLNGDCKVVVDVVMATLDPHRVLNTSATGATTSSIFSSAISSSELMRGNITIDSDVTNIGMTSSVHDDVNGQTDTSSCSSVTCDVSPRSRSRIYESSDCSTPSSDEMPRDLPMPTRNLNTGSSSGMTSSRWRKQQNQSSTVSWNQDDLATYCGDLLAWQQRYRLERQQRHHNQQIQRPRNKGLSSDDVINAVRRFGDNRCDRSSPEANKLTDPPMNSWPLSVSIEDESRDSVGQRHLRNAETSRDAVATSGVSDRTTESDPRCMTYQPHGNGIDQSRPRDIKDTNNNDEQDTAEKAAERKSLLSLYHIDLIDSSLLTADSCDETMVPELTGDTDMTSFSQETRTCKDSVVINVTSPSCPYDSKTVCSEASRDLHGLNSLIEHYNVQAIETMYPHELDHYSASEPVKDKECLLVNVSTERESDSAVAVAGFEENDNISSPSLLSSFNANDDVISLSHDMDVGSIQWPPIQSIQFDQFKHESFSNGSQSTCTNEIGARAACDEHNKADTKLDLTQVNCKEEYVSAGKEKKQIILNSTETGLTSDDHSSTRASSPAISIMDSKKSFLDLPSNSGLVSYQCDNSIPVSYQRSNSTPGLFHTRNSRPRSVLYQRTNSTPFLCQPNQILRQTQSNENKCLKDLSSSSNSCPSLFTAASPTTSLSLPALSMTSLLRMTSSNAMVSQPSSFRSSTKASMDLPVIVSAFSWNSNVNKVRLSTALLPKPFQLNISSPSCDLPGTFNKRNLLGVGSIPVVTSSYDISDVKYQSDIRAGRNTNITTIEATDSTARISSDAGALPQTNNTIKTQQKLRIGNGGSLKVRQTYLDCSSEKPTESSNLSSMRSTNTYQSPFTNSRHSLLPVWTPRPFQSANLLKSTSTLKILKPDCLESCSTANDENIKLLTMTSSNDQAASHITSPEISVFPESKSLVESFTYNEKKIPAIEEQNLPVQKDIILDRQPDIDHQLLQRHSQMDYQPQQHNSNVDYQPQPHHSFTDHRPSIDLQPLQHNSNVDYMTQPPHSFMDHRPSIDLQPLQHNSNVDYQTQPHHSFMDHRPSIDLQPLQQIAFLTQGYSTVNDDVILSPVVGLSALRALSLTLRQQSEDDITSCRANISLTTGDDVMMKQSSKFDTLNSLKSKSLDINSTDNESSEVKPKIAQERVSFDSSRAMDSYNNSELTSRCRGTYVDDGLIMAVSMSKGAFGIGFCIEGGTDCPSGPSPIRVKRIFRADSCLHEGDLIESVNGTSFIDMSHFDAWKYLKSLPAGCVTFSIRRK